jgi:hypothetical protein
MAFVQVPSSGSQVNLSYAAGNPPVAGATGYGTWLLGGMTWPVQGNLSLQNLQLISSGNQVISVEFRG